MYDKSTMQSFVKVRGAWVPLMRYRELKAERRREIAGAVAFIVLISTVLFGMLWITP